MPIKPEHLNELLSGYEKPEELLGEERAVKAAQEGAARAGAGRRADAASRLRERRPCRPRNGQQLQRNLGQDGCAYQELHPTILMMKSAEDRPRAELTEPFNRPMRRRILAEGLMRSEFVVIARVVARIRRRWASPKTTM